MQVHSLARATPIMWLGSPAHLISKGSLLSFHPATPSLSKRPGEEGDGEQGRKEESTATTVASLPCRGKPCRTLRHGALHISPLYRWGSWGSLLSPLPKTMHEQWGIQDSKPVLCDTKACAHGKKKMPETLFSTQPCTQYCPVSHLTSLTMILEGKRHHPHFTDEDTEAQRGHVALQVHSAAKHVWCLDKALLFTPELPPLLLKLPVASASASRSSVTTTTGSMPTASTTALRPSTDRTGRWWQTLNKVFAFE